MSGEMDVHPVRYEFDFEELKATEGYNPPDDFLIQVLPLGAGGTLPGRETNKKFWYEYPSPLKEWNLPSTQLQLQLEEDEERRNLEEREERRQQLEADMHWRRLVERERQHQEERQRQLQLQLEEQCRHWWLPMETEQQRQRLAAIQHQRLDERQRQRLDEWHRRRLEAEWHRLRQEQDNLYLDEMWANSSTTECWGSDNETPTYASSTSPARDAPEEHQSHVEEHQFHVKEHQVHVQMYENDAANIPRCRLFNSEADTEELRLKFPLKIPYYIYAGRCNLKLEGYELRYADLFPNFDNWSYSWVRPTTYDGDDQYVDFWSELMGEVEYTNTKDRVLAKAIAIAIKGFRKMLYFQIEIAVLDCRMLLEHKEMMEQKCDLYGYIASEIYFKKQEYESVLERIMNGHEVLRYELTELGSDANEDDAWEMREFVDHLVRSTPIELPSATRFDDEYRKWVYKQINLQSKQEFHLYVNYLVEKINMAQDLDLAPEDTS